MPVLLRIHGDRFHAKLGARSRKPDRNFTAVAAHHLLEWLGSWQLARELELGHESKQNTEKGAVKRKECQKRAI